MKHSLIRLLHGMGRNVALGNCFDSELSYEHVKPDHLAKSLAVGHIALRQGYFTVGGVEPSVEAEALERERLLLEYGRVPDPNAQLHFGIWHDTTQQSPVETPAEMRVSSRPGGAAGFVALIMRESAITISHING